MVRKWVTTVLWIPEEHYASDGDGGDNSDDDNGHDENGDDFISLQFFPGHSRGVNCNFQKIRYTIDILARGVPKSNRLSFENETVVCIHNVDI